MNANTYSTALTVLAVAQIGIMSPGPDSLLVIRNSIRYPLVPAIGTSLGISAGVMVHLTLCTVGLAALVAGSPRILELITYLGAVYLLNLGYKILKSASDGSLNASVYEKSYTTWAKAFREGLLCNLTNPKVSLFFLGLFSQLIPINDTIQQRAIYAALLGIHSVLYWMILAVLIKKLGLDTLIIRWGGLVDKIFGILLVGISLRIVLQLF